MPAAKRKGKSEVSIIGTGRLGTTLAVSLAGRGYSIRSLVARTVQSAQKAARLLDAEVQVLAARQLRSLVFADLFLITVPDDQILSLHPLATYVGGTKVFNKHITQDIYYLRQNDGVSVLGDLNVVGTTLRVKL